MDIYHWMLRRFRRKNQWDLNIGILMGLYHHWIPIISWFSLVSPRIPIVYNYFSWDFRHFNGIFFDISHFHGIFEGFQPFFWGFSMVKQPLTAALQLSCRAVASARKISCSVRRALSWPSTTCESSNCVAWRPLTYQHLSICDIHYTNECAYNYIVLYILLLYIILYYIVLWT